MPEALAPENGMLIRLAPGPAEVVARVPAGRLALDGKVLVAADSEAIRHRHRLSFNGVIMGSVVIDKAGKLLAPPQISFEGLMEATAAGEAIATIQASIAAFDGASWSPLGPGVAAPIASTSGWAAVAVISILSASAAVP